jgi:Flp pilus assembly protein TadD
MTRFSAASLLVLAAFALAGCSMIGMADSSSEAKEKDIAAVKEKAQSPKTIAADIDGNLRQAMLLRQAGSNDAAIRILSQLMLADADNSRVVAEYGKTLAQMGRAQDATQFLRRAIELSSTDWTLYSALGVSYDQLNDQINARLAYEHALALKPGDASVLNNFALSRMLAKDPDGARLLIAQAQAAAGGAADPKIARNVALIAGMAPEKTAEAEKPSAAASAVKSALDAGTPVEPKIAAAAPAPRQAAKPAPAKVAVVAPRPAPPIAVTEMPAPPQPAPQNVAAQGPQNAGDVSKLLASQSPVASQANAAPRQLTQQPAAPVQVAAQAPSGVVMQAVPYDPFAGPVLTLKKPKAVAKAAPKTDTAKTDTAKTDTAKAAPPKTAKADKPADAPKADKASASKTDVKAAGPQKAAATKSDIVPSLRVAADKY